jgi:hypothetical protein
MPHPEGASRSGLPELRTYNCGTARRSVDGKGVSAFKAPLAALVSKTLVHERHCIKNKGAAAVPRIRLS